MVSAAEAADRLDQHRAFVGAAAEAGVRHVVYTSFQGAAPDCTFTLGRDHWATEQAIRETGLACTFLRDSFYADFLPLMAQDGVIRGPAGDGRVAAVAREDVAAVAAVVLADPGAHAGAAYDLTGPEALTLGEAAAVIAEVTGRPTRYVDETLEEAYARGRPTGHRTGRSSVGLDLHGDRGRGGRGGVRRRPAAHRSAGHEPARPAHAHGQRRRIARVSTTGSPASSEASRSTTASITQS